MPQINRFRIVNFRYDDDKKYIANEIYEFDGRNALINLENGGGKSVILQLALQSVMPNTSIGSRNFSDYFKVGTSPTHIMVEWKLDGTRAEYLLTGICISKNADGLRYYTYTQTYTLPHDIDIKGIEAVSRDKQVIGFSEYHNYLKRLSTEMRIPINVYSRDRQRDYRERLHTFNLFREEFGAIKIINQAEGGIDKFFEDARKSRNVIEKLIIPNIPQAEGEYSGILAETFKKHIENLKNIPLYQHNIKMYDAFCSKTASLINNLEGYGTKVEEINNAGRDILAFDNLLGIGVDRLINECESLMDNDKGFAAMIEELTYKKVSLDYQKKLMELEEIKTRHERKTEEIALLVNEIHETDRKIKYINSAIAYKDMLECRLILSEQYGKLETLTREKDDIYREYQNCIYYAYSLLCEEKKEKDKILDELNLKYMEQLNEKKELLNKLEKKNIDRDSIRDSLSSINTRLQEARERYSKITAYFAKDMTLLVEPSEGLQNIKNEKEMLFNKKETYIGEIDRWNNSNNDYVINETRIKEALASENEKKNNKEQELENFHKRFSRINRELSMYEIEGDVYSIHGSELLNALKLKADNKLGEISGKYHELIKRKILFEGCEYYVPDIEVKKVYDFLKGNGVRCIPGSLWLNNQREDLREALLHKNPLLCYSIVVEKNEMEKIKGFIKELLDMVESFPVTFIADTEEGIITSGEYSDKESKGLDRVGTMEAYVLFSKNNSFSIQPQLFSSYLAGMDKDIGKIKDEYEAIKRDVEKITGLMERCGQFIEMYPEGYLKETENFIDATLDGIRKNEAALKDFAGKRELIAKKTKENQEKIKNIEEIINEKDKDIENLSLYIELGNKIAELDKIYREEEGKRLKIEQDKNSISSSINGISKEIENTKYKMDSISQKSRDRIKLMDDISMKLTIKELSMEITGVLDEVLKRAEGLHKKIDDSSEESIRMIIDMQKKNVSDKQKFIQINGFYETDFIDGIIDYTEEELKNETKLYNELSMKKDAASEEERSLLVDEKTLEGKVDQIRSDIEKRFGHVPYEFQHIEGVDISSFNAQIDAVNKKKTRNLKAIDEKEKRRIRLLEYKGRLDDYISEKDIKINSDSRENMDSFTYGGESFCIWDILQLPVENIAVAAKGLQKQYLDLTRIISDMQMDINRSYDELYKESDWAENITIRTILENIIKKDMYNYKYVKSLFDDIILSVQNMKNAAQFQLEESLRDKDEIVERCFQKAEAIYDEVRTVDGFSKIKLDGAMRKTILIEAPALHPEEGKALMTRYIEVSISEIEKMKSEGKYDPARIDDEIAKIMSPVRLLDAVTNLNEYSIKVYKPESTLGASRYIPWEVVINWSGGEKLAGFFAMFISIISYLRYKKTGWQGSSKVIWIDNPFGQANADYLLSYIFDLAKATNTQMICLTGHMQVDIYKQFDVVYSLIHRMLAGMNMSVIQSKLVKSQGELESASYRVKHEQMTLF
ncbi:chromosome partitioning protein ParA [Pseudobacteroides cellulosolvens]|uniref:Chromosome segregation ATPase-like protein n=1 Tax=Pseudobacteroides cellulosolvens ATCC 35603 = DSM 2933 TaxID=398512 RepID=A0A0L6JLB3_9FIRM|nr:chromosome partitioning protein ParA [Pseudobacteroides cellulosolvens]KNY26535.1 hypothetical protein Bccel_1800 [Pseudobacteroides cellulosolvens ATCC 35603 = DSM 2933]